MLPSKSTSASQGKSFGIKIAELTSHFLRSLEFAPILCIHVIFQISQNLQIAISCRRTYNDVWFYTLVQAKPLICLKHMLLTLNFGQK